MHQAEGNAHAPTTTGRASLHSDVVPALRDRLIGTTLRGTYRIERRRDSGGMGVVYEARHLRLGSTVAVKVMASHLVANQQALARFQAEAQVIAALSHPHVVQVLDYDTTEMGEPYLVMELLEGDTLETTLERQGTLSPAAALSVLKQLADGLSAAHDRGVIHRDLKPANVILQPLSAGRWHAKLIDFGISKADGNRPLTDAQTMLGTPQYMAPEQVTDKSAGDPRIDQYALALLFYEMLTGCCPFATDSTLTTLQLVAHTTAPPLPAKFPRALDQAVQRGLKKNQAERYADVAELAAALEAACGDIPQNEMSCRALRHSATWQKRGPRAPDAPTQLAPATSTADCARRLVQRCETALSEQRHDDAVLDAEQLLAQASASSDVETRDIVQNALAVLERAFVARLGGFERTLQAQTSGASLTSLDLSPEQAFVISRLDGGLTADQALDVLPMPRLQALRLLAGLVTRGVLNAG